MNTPQVDERRIRQLVELSTQALAGGRTQDADRLLRQAQAEAPRHPLVVTETSRRLLLSGNAAGAHQLLTQALAADPSQLSLWLNLAAALRGLGRPEEEMAALNKVLAGEPRNMRALLQKASLQELQGQPRAAAMTFRYALQMIPPGFDPPPPLQPILQQAKAVVDANDRALEVFLEERLRDLRAQYPGEP
ncbi:MAG TPA: tetratricopeptide repeat protein, partial [Steroidobacteraceae bacterium]|nr:tetratricopeptide repeat protein [Steroidobacteraceae bacterium]